MRNVFVCLTAIACVSSGVSSAQNVDDYGSRPIRLVVPVPPGGNNDLVARIVTNALVEHAGFKFVVDNRPGGGGVIAVETVAHAAPDGRTLLFAFSSFVMTPFMTKVSYDPVKDFTPIALISGSPLLLVVNNSVPATNIKELIALAKSRPKGINGGIPSSGSAGHLALELFKLRSGTQDGIVSIGYSGGGPAQIALMSGEVQLVFASVPTATPYVKSGKVKAIAAIAPNRLPTFPDVQTARESGLDLETAAPWTSIQGPAKLPRPIVLKLNAEIDKILKRPDIIEKLAVMGSDAVGGKPEVLADRMAKDMKEFAKVIPVLGLRTGQ